MKKITQNAANAFNNNQSFKMTNTEIRIEGDTTKMLLHGHCIAEKKDGILTIRTCGWNTNTTKERLNALPGVHINQKNWQWYLDGTLWNGHAIQI